MGQISGGTAVAGANLAIGSMIAAVTIGGHKVVYAIGNDQVGLASADVPDHPAIGITTHAAVAGDPIAVQSSGEMIEPSWAWSAAGPVYCGLNGAMTQTPPTVGLLQQIGFVTAPTRLIIAIQSPIRLM